MHAEDLRILVKAKERALLRKAEKINIRANDDVRLVLAVPSVGFRGLVLFTFP